MRGHRPAACDPFFEWKILGGLQLETRSAEAELVEKTKVGAERRGDVAAQRGAS